MTEHRPAHCHPDRTLGRVLAEHYNDCEDPRSHRGCVPCDEPHCAICGRTHLDPTHALTCDTCIGKIRDDLDVIATTPQLLADEAIEAGGDGRLAAAAPIPGGTAQILNGPQAAYGAVLATSATAARHFAKLELPSVPWHEDHTPKDPRPPLTVLALWEDRYRAYLDHRAGGRATLESACAYLATQLTYIAQRTDGPDFLTFTRQIRTVRADLERALHDERAPERGVECFECGEQLVRRFRDPNRCTHDTPARIELAGVVRRALRARAWLATLATYPEAGGPTPAEVIDALGPEARLVAAARVACGACGDQGGIDDPSPGMSWECPGCRKDYDPGEYANAVRRDLLTRGPDGDGWTHVAMAAEAASTLVGKLVPSSTVRQWIVREKVASRLGDTGVRLVFWPDVADRAVEAARRLDEKAARQLAKGA